jgi:hypothetical protein
MNEDRLNEIEAAVRDWPDTRLHEGFAELVAEVRRLRDGITGLADECEKVPPANAQMNAWQRAHAAFARSLRALLADPGDSHTHAHTGGDEGGAGDE